MIPPTFLLDVRDDIEKVIKPALPAGVEWFEIAPDDFLQVPAVILDQTTCSRGFEVPGSTVVRTTVIVVAQRTDTPTGVLTLDELGGIVWVALGAGSSIALSNTRGQCKAQSLQVSNLPVGDTTWPTLSIDSDITLMSGVC